MIEQVGIVIFGLTGIVLANFTHNEARKWAPIFGLVGQIFWFWAAIKSKQWGMLFMSVAYTGAWIVGVYNHWFAKKDRKVGI